MDKAAFTALFHEAVETACEAAEKALGRPLSRDVIIKMFGAGIGGNEIEPQTFLDLAYIDDHTFYRLIDFMIVKVRGATPVIFARISGHKPGPLSQCWHGEKGPFKHLQAYSIDQV